MKKRIRLDEPKKNANKEGERKKFWTVESY